MTRDELLAASDRELADYAREQGLASVGVRPHFGHYLRELWDRRGFLWTLSSAKYYAKNEGQRFGQLWGVINPLLLILTYLFIFGFLLGTNRGIQNYVGFLSCGIIIFGMTAATMTSGSRAILNNTGLVRALHFPRAVLPLSTVITEFLEMVVGVVVLLIIMPFTGELPHWSWIMLPVALALQLLMQAGLVLILARLVNMSADLWNLVPVAVRLLRYASGVFFSIAATTENHRLIYLILEYQPFALQLTLARQSLMTEFPFLWHQWAVAAAWAILLPAVGLWIFWRDEAKYGRG